MKTAWITGAAGLIGSHLVSTAPQFAPGFKAVGLTRAQLELTDDRALREAFHQQSPALVIHCAAMSRTPECEANPALARRVNVEVTARLVELAAGIPFFFFSTDLVFDGEKGSYVETDALNPLSVYGETKAEAERVVLRNPRHTVLRTSLNCGASPSGKRSFNEEWRLTLAAGKTMKLFTDEYRCPIPVEATVRAVWEMAAQSQPGLYHLAGAERLSRWAMGRLFAQRWPGLGERMQPVSRKDYDGAPRPPDTSMDSGKIQKLLSFPLPKLSQWLTEHPDARI